MNLLFCLIFLRHPKARGRCSQSEATLFRRGTKNLGALPETFSGGTEQSRVDEAAGRRNCPEAVPKKMNGEKGGCTELVNPRRGGTYRNSVHARSIGYGAVEGGKFISTLRRVVSVVRERCLPHSN